MLKNSSIKPFNSTATTFMSISGRETTEKFLATNRIQPNMRFTDTKNDTGFIGKTSNYFECLPTAPCDFSKIVRKRNRSKEIHDYEFQTSITSYKRRSPTKSPDKDRSSNGD